ncbi:MAG: aminodeoxychorismate/anthranilate synthase component II, partial [Congregibacter sp.]|nr:aminodeoxychorismate/anthranilate synthase component II [Congregibacter sp.]
VVQYLAELGAEVQVFRNDEITVEEIKVLAPERIVISPGPCTPNEAGVSMEIIREFAGKVPLLGICLGHQSLGQVFGGEVVRARRVMHGKTSAIHHDGGGVFSGLPSPFIATRYHSLVVARDSLPPDFEVSAWTLDAQGEIDEIMGLRHRLTGAEGVQFHPESVLSEHGHALLNNFLQQSVPQPIPQPKPPPMTQGGEGA